MKRIPLIDEYRKFWKQIKQTFQFHHFTLNQSLPKSYFESGVCPELDAVDQTRIRATEHIQCIQTRLNGIIGNPNACKMINNDKEGHFFIALRNVLKFYVRDFKISQSLYKCETRR